MAQIFLSNGGFASGGTGVSVHGALSGLLANDHPQYRLTATSIDFQVDVINTAHTHVAAHVIDFDEAAHDFLTGTPISGAITFDPNYTGISHQEGSIHWNSEDGCLEVDMPGGSVTLQVGQEQLIRVRNTTGFDILNGQVISVTGSSGNRPTVALAIASADSCSCGIATETISNGHNGYVTTFGLVRSLNTSAYTEGTILYLSDTVPGGMTSTPPLAPNHTVMLAIVVNSHQSEGAILFKPMPAYNLHNLSDVNGTTPDSTNKFLIWNDSQQYWDSGTISFSDIQSTAHTHDYVSANTNVVFDNITATSITTTGSSVHTTDLYASGTIYSGGVPLQTIFSGGGGDVTTEQFTGHTGDSTIHFTKASIDLFDLGTTAHTHDISEIANTAHTHDYADGGSFTSHTADSSIHFTEASIDIANITSAHTHDISEISNTAHTHDYADASSFTSHTADSSIHFTEASIDISNITSGHGHTLDELDQGGASDGQVLAWDSGTSQWAPADPVSTSGDAAFHNSLSGLQGGQSSQYYHLTSSEWTTLRGGSGNADALHSHDFSGITNTAHTHDYASNDGFTAHTADSSVHFTESSIDIANITSAHTHTEVEISDLGDYAERAPFTSHTADSGIHFTEASIDIANITSAHTHDFFSEVTATAHTHTESDITDLGDYAGTSDLTAHTADSSIHFTVASLNLDQYAQDAEFTAHTADTTIHFVKGDVNLFDLGSTSHTHTLDEIIGEVSEGQFTAHTADSTIHFTESSIDIANITSAHTHDFFTEIENTGHTHVESDITDLGDYAEKSPFTSHTADSTIHYTKDSIDLFDLNSTAHTHDYAAEGSFTSHTADSSIHFTEASIDIDNIVSSHTHSVGELTDYTSADTAYNRATPSYESVGGVTAGVTTFSGSVQDALDAILYPYLEPAFTSFSIGGQSTTLEVGQTAATGNITFNWNTSNSSNVSANTVDVRDVTNATDLITNTADDSSESYDNGTGITKTSQTSHQWSIDADDTQGSNFSRNFTVYWRWRFYWGSSTATTATEAIIEGLQNDNLYTSIGRTYTCDANNYKWICWPTSFGEATSFTLNGFDYPMEAPETVSVTNAYGVTTDYYAYRSVNPSASEVAIVVT